MSRNPKAKQSTIPGAISAPIPTATAGIPSFDTLPDSALIRESCLVQSPKRPDRPAPLPFSGATLWRKVKAGTFPQPIKLGAKITAFRVGEVRAWLNSQSTVTTA
ncbi:MAG: AlpA family phage regulatory protein [Hydrogenophaga sp.]|nr:AlpA family phage regulatory protein [Hydrogenophaga sp.]